jgi:hypothetical protein
VARVGRAAEHEEAREHVDKGAAKERPREPIHESHVREEEARRGDGREEYR